MVWRTGIGALTDMLSVVDVTLSVDSGIMHMSAALDRPTVALFAAGSPEMFAPTDSKHHVMAMPSMPCRPCFDVCSRERQYCFDYAHPEKVAKAVEGLLQDPAKNGDVFGLSGTEN